MTKQRSYFPGGYVLYLNGQMFTGDYRELKSPDQYDKVVELLFRKEQRGDRSILYPVMSTKFNVGKGIISEHGMKVEYKIQLLFRGGIMN